MTKPRSEALKRAYELIERNVPRYELAPFVGEALQELIDEQQGWMRRVETAEWEAKEALHYAKACEKGAAEWKAKADEASERAEKAEARLAELVAELRECVRTCQGNTALFAILDRYEGGEHRKVTVCDACLMASCWQSVFMCERARDAGTTQKTVSELRALGREHESYWKAEGEHG